jgi:hypothetical protein
MSTPSLYQIVERKTWEHGQLRQKLLCFQAKYKGTLDLCETVTHVTTSLDEALQNFDAFGPTEEVELKRKSALSNGPTVAKKQPQLPKISSTTSLQQRIEEQRQENAYLEQGPTFLEENREQSSIYVKK